MQMVKLAYYGQISPGISKVRTAEGLLSIALTNKKFTYATGVPKKFGSKQTKIQRKKSFLFPDLQETVDATVVLEFMKITMSNL